MKIAVQQLDGKIPNLAIMKIVNYHQLKGDSVKWYEGDMFNSNYDRVYFSKIFNFTKNPTIYENCVIGGTGIDFTNKLPDEIEEIHPSYTLKNLGCKPFVMPYNKFDEYQKKLARWVNHRAIFNTVKFENYKS